MPSLAEMTTTTTTTTGIGGNETQSPEAGPCDVTSERQNENIIGGDLRSAMISPAAARKSSAKVVINGRTN